MVNTYRTTENAIDVFIKTSDDSSQKIVMAVEGMRFALFDEPTILVQKLVKDDIQNLSFEDISRENQHFEVVGSCDEVDLISSSLKDHFGVGSVLQIPDFDDFSVKKQEKFVDGIIVVINQQTRPEKALNYLTKISQNYHKKLVSLARVWLYVLGADPKLDFWITTATNLSANFPNLSISVFRGETFSKKNFAAIFTQNPPPVIFGNSYHKLAAIENSKAKSLQNSESQQDLGDFDSVPPTFYEKTSGEFQARLGDVDQYFRDREPYLVDVDPASGEFSLFTIYIFNLVVLNFSKLSAILFSSIFKFS